MNRSLFDFVLLIKLLQGGGSSSGVPEVSSIENVGIDRLGYYQVRFFDTEGLNLLATEWVKKGEDCEYGDVSSLLIESEANDVLTENKGEDYVSGASAWGDVVLNGTGYSKSGDEIALTSASYGTFNLTNANQSVTVYAVIQQYESTSGDLGLLAVGYANSSGNSPGFFSRNGALYTSLWGTDVSTGLSATDKHLLVIRIDGTKKRVYFYADGVAYGNYGFSNSGAQVQISSYINGTISCNAYVSYFAVVDGVESEYKIFANSNYIMNYYLKGVHEYVWALTPDTGTIATDITKNVQNSMDLYLARWKVSYWDKFGTSILHEEYVIDGEDAVWGADKDWSNVAEGEAIAGILEDVHSNYNVYRVKASWARIDSIVIDAATVLMTHSGQRQPAIKTNNGEASVLFCYNCGGAAWGGNWFSLFVFGKTAADCEFSCPTAGGVSSFVYNGNTYYYKLVSMSPSWGGAEVYNNPCGVPEMHDVQMFVVNGPVLADGLEAAATFLEFD